MADGFMAILFTEMTGDILTFSSLASSPISSASIFSFYHAAYADLKPKCIFIFKISPVCSLPTWPLPYFGEVPTVPTPLPIYINII